MCLIAAAGLTGCGAKARKARLLASADRDFAAEKYDAADLEYHGVLQVPPPDPAAIRQLGLLYSIEGRPATAVAYLKRASELEPKNLAVQVKLGQAALGLGNAPLARDLAKKVLAIEPKNADAVLLLVDSARSAADQDADRKTIEGLEKTGDCAAYHVALGGICIVRRDQAGADAEIQKAIALDPKYAPAYADQAALRLTRTDVKGAVESYRHAADLSPLRSLERLKYISLLSQSGSVPEAKKELTDLTTKAPDYIPGWVYSMRLASGERRYADCTDIIGKILTRDPSNYDALLEKGMLDLAQSDFKTGVTDLRHAEAVYPKSPQVKFELALAYLRTGDMASAADRVNQAVASAPDYAPAVVLWADIHIRQGDPAAAVDRLERLLKRQPNDRQAYLLLAQAYLAARDPASARATYARMQTAFPKDPEPPFRTGLIVGSSGQSQEARKDFEQSLTLLPFYGPAEEALVALDLAEKHPEGAEARAKAMIAKYPKAAGPWFMMARVDITARRTDAAEADLRKVIELDPTYDRAYFALAQIYLATKKTDAAIERLTALVAKTKSTSAQMQIGAIHNRLQQYDLAAADYQKALTLDPRLAGAMNDLAYLYAEHLGKLDEAQALATQARTLAPDSPNIADTLGWIHFRRGDAKGALTLIQGAADRSPDDLAIAFHLGMIQYALGDEAAARTLLGRVAAPGADAADAPAAKGRLDLLAIDPATAGPAERAVLEKELKAEPNDPVALMRMAVIEVRAGDAASAARDFERTRELAPNQSAVLLPLAQLYAGPLHQPDKARELAKRAHALAPDDPAISRTLGRLLYATGDYGRAVDLLAQAAQAQPADLPLAFDLARAYFAVGRLPDAAHTLEPVQNGSSPQRADAEQFSRMMAAEESPAAAAAAAEAAAQILARDPANLPALMVTALAQDAAGKTDAAEALYQKILAADPLFLPAGRRLTRIEAERGEAGDPAYALAGKVRQAYPEDPDVAMTVGIMDYARKDYRGGVRVLQMSLDARPDDPETLYYLGLCHYRLHEFAGGRTELRKALALKLTVSQTEEARKALAAMK